jgi:hypothetical protein
LHVYVYFFFMLCSAYMTACIIMTIIIMCYNLSYN